MLVTLLVLKLLRFNSFNDNTKKENENTSLYEDDNVSKISIIIDYKIK